MKPLRAYLEVAGKRSIAVAIDWPGWCRSAKTAEAALETLAAYAPRYARVVKRAKISLPREQQFEVVATVRGDASTDFGVPGRLGPGDENAPAAQVRTAHLTLLRACWDELDEVAKTSPQVLRKGPRGGGRDRDKMLHHVLDAEVAYASRLGLKIPAPSLDHKAIEANRAALLDVLGETGGDTQSPDGKKRWPFAYAVRRIAWHVLDHAWEMEDRREP